MKTNYEVCHEFATGNKNAGRSNSIFFETDCDGDRLLYSYGYHFCMCRITAAGLCFFTTREYSVTTSQHKSNARGAVSHYDIIFCPYPESARRSFEAWENDFKSIKAAINNAGPRAVAKLIQDGEKLLNAVKVFCNKTGEKLPAWYKSALKSLPKNGGPEYDKLVERQKKVQQKRIKERRARVERWENGENLRLDYDETAQNVPLRLEARKGYTIIMTAKGVPVTLEAARVFYNRVKSGALHKWERVETGAACYSVRAVTNKYIQIGCHRFQIAYLDKFYKKMQTA